jgi:hypothetical protein
MLRADGRSMETRPHLPTMGCCEARGDFRYRVVVFTLTNVATIRSALKCRPMSTEYGNRRRLPLAHDMHQFLSTNGVANPPGCITGCRTHGHAQLPVNHPSPRIASQSWRFVALEVRVISAKKDALQALSVPQNVTWNPFTIRGKEIDESVDRGGHTLVNQRIRPR